MDRIPQPSPNQMQNRLPKYHNIIGLLFCVRTSSIHYPMIKPAQSPPSILVELARHNRREHHVLLVEATLWLVKSKDTEIDMKIPVRSHQELRIAAAVVGHIGLVVEGHHIAAAVAGRTAAEAAGRTAAEEGHRTLAVVEHRPVFRQALKRLTLDKRFLNTCFSSLRS